MTPKTRCLSTILAAFLLTLLWGGGHQATAGSASFPLFDCLADNVAFWKDVYSRYGLDEGIVHDKDELAIVYEVVKLADPDQPGAQRINRQRIKRVKTKYERILADLAAGKPPASADERRVAALFAGRPARVLRAARHNIRLQQGQRDRFQEGVIRSGVYLDEMKAIFADYGLPVDLVYLAHVESSFNVNAYSKFGAAGIWQFTRGTGKRFMRVDYTVDERRDPIRATHAAARYLKENYARLGSWPLALTAYNHGANGMARAKRAHGDYESVFRNYNGGRFGFASRNFYSEFLAAREVAKHYRHYFGALALDRPRHIHEVKLAGYAAVTDLADYFGVDLDRLKALNPALRPPVFKGQKYVPEGYRLRLPHDGRRTAQLVAALPADLFKASQKRSRFYQVRHGDTAGRIARRHGVKLGDLIMANQLDRRATIYVGQNLRIPTPEEVVLLAASPVKREIVAAGPDRPAAGQAEKPPVLTKVASLKMPALPPPEAAPAPAPEPAAETPAAQAPPDLAALNTAVITGHLQIEKIEQRRGRTIGTIRVEVGETLGHYAEWLDIRAQDLRRLNGLRYGRVIRVNQTIRIPLDAVSKEVFEERRYEYHKEIEEDFFAAYRVEDLRNYVIKRGDNIWTLSRDEFDVPLWLVRKFNAEIDLDGLKPAQEVVVPVVEKRVS